MTNRNKTLIAALAGSLALGLSATAFADRGHDRGGPGWGHEKHARWHHQHQYRYNPEPYGYISIQTAPRVIYSPAPVYYGPRYAYPAPPARYVYPAEPYFSFGMTVPLD